MIKGILSATTDLNFAINASLKNDENLKVIYLGDPVGFDNKYNFIIASPLVPTYECIAADIDGSSEQFAAMYTAQLNSIPSLEFFAIILRALYNKTSLILYFPEDAKELKYVQFLLNYITVQFGITCSTLNHKFMYNPDYNSNNMALMFNFSLVSPQEVILYSTALDEVTINRLILSINPKDYNILSISDKVKFLKEYKDRMLRFGNALQRPIIYEYK